MQQILKNIFDLWKSSYLILLPQIILITFCFASYNFFHNTALAVIMYLPGLYFSNYVLLKLADISNKAIKSEKYYYNQALLRLFDTLVLFIGLTAVFIILVLALWFLAGPILGAITALVLLIIYSYMIFSYAYLVIQNQSPITAIKSSFRLINSHIWLITGVFLVLGIIEGLIYFILLFFAGINISAVIYNLLFTSLNLAICVVALKDLKQKS